MISTNNFVVTLLLIRQKCLGIDSLLINSQIFVNFFLDF
uniref:Bm1053 n=1 Tax=Brugia malayi TaxID=6279 RepID=A0A1I9G6E4_BRUMA|nr:Bm1053 [Brugia malayi]